MANFSINLALNWENRDELQRLLQNVTETQQAFQNALKEFSEFEPEIHVVSENRGDKNETTSRTICK